MLNLSPLNRNLPAALRDATHPKESVRLSAIAELGLHALDSPSATAVLEKALLDDASVEVRRAAAVALADGAAKGSVSHLLRAAEDRDPRVRQMALLALGEVGDAARQEVAATLQTALSGSLPALRFQALASLVGLDIDTDASITRALEDSDRHVRLLALRLINDRAQTAPEASAVTSSWQALVQQHLNDELPTVRLAAALVLQGLGDVEASRVLCELLNDAKVRVEAEEELRAVERVGRAGLVAAIPGLRRRAGGGFWAPTLLQWPARIALALLGDERAKGQIVSGLHAWTWQGRTTAAYAAGKARLSAAKAPLRDLALKPDAADPHVVQEALQQIESSPMDTVLKGTVSTETGDSL